jgi:hypothetical protein
MVVAEAMAAGLPVVALDAPGVREVVNDKGNGRLLEVESRKKFASALLWCTSRSVVQWNQIKKAALKTANDFSSEICADKALRVYQSVRLRQDPFSQDESSQWRAVLGRFKTELEMMLNLGRAAGSALVKTAVVESAPKDKIAKLYQKIIEESRHSWMLALKKMRKQIKDVPEETKTKLESVSEAVTQKIRTYERELAELNRKVVNACETLEKFITDARVEMKNEFQKAKDSSRRKR